MAETGQSKLYLLKPLIEKWPAVTKPDGHVAFKTKILWTTFCLILYFILTKVTLYGVAAGSLDAFEQFRAILAGASGSLMHLGIGPIVTGSIIMQLFTGAKIIKLDLTKKDDKAIYQGTQKIVVVMMILVESIPQVFGFLQPETLLVSRLEGWSLWPGHGIGLAQTIIVAQLALGAIIVFLMDELISKWGIGSGISLFIAAGVSEQIFTGTFNWQPVQEGADYNPISNPPAGTLPKVWYVFTSRSIGSLVYQGGFEDVFIGNFQTFPNSVASLVGTILVFFFVVYAESSRIELPLSHGKVRGARGRYPIRLIYASNIPVILMAALLANVNLFALLFTQHAAFRQTPLIGGKWWIGMFPPSDSSGFGGTTPIGGGAWYVSSFNGFQEWLLPILDYDRYGSVLQGHDLWQLYIRMFAYLFLFVGGSILFAKFWIETTNMGPHAVARQIQNSGMQIPGFRRDPRVLQRILERYIPTVTIIGGFIVGALAALADMVGTVGQSSGTGVLLTVGILIRMYEQIAKEQAMEMHPVLRGFFGVE